MKIVVTNEIPLPVNVTNVSRVVSGFSGHNHKKRVTLSFLMCELVLSLIRGVKWRRGGQDTRHESPKIFDAPICWPPFVDPYVAYPKAP